MDGLVERAPYIGNHAGSPNPIEECMLLLLLLLLLLHCNGIVISCADITTSGDDHGDGEMRKSPSPVRTSAGSGIWGKN
ncbi:hypothetical protein F4775DRAFT_575322 [Biscogniauxia sp. FL1348]|nr:hypothetical protein F4775DRAFT_575322 [Biscogniauxia sp. FL1348]